jgi:hypothetical protein
MSNPLAKVIRYLASNVVLNATWTRVGTLATVTTASNHGYASGFHKIAGSSDITAIPNGNYDISVTGLNTFTLVCLNAGALNGTLTSSANGMQITASDVQSAIDQIDLLLTTNANALSNHKVNHQNGGIDELNVAGLNGLLADQQTPLGHVARHQNGGDDELNVAGLNGLLADQQSAGLIHNAVINITGLAVNYTLQYNGTQWIVTNALSGVIPGAHATTHAVGGTDPILGELTDPQRAGKIFTAVINITGLADQFILYYDPGTLTWKVKSRYHASEHEFGGLDPIPSLPTAAQKLALLGTSGAPGAGNEYVTDLDKSTNIDPYLPSPNEKNAMLFASAPSASNPFATKSDLSAAPSSSVLSKFRSGASPIAFKYTPVTHKRGTPVIFDRLRFHVKTIAGGTLVKPVALIDVPCTKQNFAPGSTAFNASGTIIPTNGFHTGLTTTGIVDDAGSGDGTITLSAVVPVSITAGDYIVVTGATDPNNNGSKKIVSIASPVITIRGTFSSSQISAGALVASTKYVVGGIIEPIGTALNNNTFTILTIVGTTLTVSPAPVNETVSPSSMDQYLPDGSIISFGFLGLDLIEPHDFDVSPSDIIQWFYNNDGAALYGKVPSSPSWSIGYQYSEGSFFVDIDANASYEDSVRITNASSPYTVLVNTRKIIADCSAGNIAVTLPAITADWHGVELKIKARAVGANAITITANASDDIDGAANVVLNIQYQSWTLLANFDIGGNSFWSIL